MVRVVSSAGRTSVESAESVPCALVIVHEFAKRPLAGLCFAAELGGDLGKGVGGHGNGSGWLSGCFWAGSGSLKRETVFAGSLWLSGCFGQTANFPQFYAHRRLFHKAVFVKNKKALSNQYSQINNMI